MPSITLEQEFATMSARIAFKDSVADLLRALGQLAYTLADLVEDKPER